MRKRSLRLVFWCLILITSAARADIGIVHGDGSLAAVFLQEGRVYYEACAGKQRPIHRGCSGKSLDTAFSTELESYTRSVQSFFGLVHNRYAGVQGPHDLDGQIEDLKAQIDDVDLSPNELNRAQAQLREWVGMRDLADEADRRILGFLTTGHDTTFSSHIQAERVEIVIQSFYGIAYLSAPHTLYRLSEPAEWNAVEAACAKIGEKWHPVQEFAPPLRNALSRTALARNEAAKAVWTPQMRPARYHLECSCSSPTRATQYNNTDISLEDYADAFRIPTLGTPENKACYKAFGGCYVLTYGFNGSFSFLPLDVQLIDLTDPASAQSTQSVPEGTSAPHAALCALDFSPGDILPPPSDQAVDFSLYNLDRGLQTLARLVYANRAGFFRDVAKTLAALPLRQSDDLALGFRNAQARLLALNLISPLLHDTQTNRIREEVLPLYERTLHEWNARLKVNALKDIELSRETYRVALSTLAAALQAAKGYVSGDDAKLIEQATPLLGKALAQGPEAKAAFIDGWKPLAALPEHLRANARTRGFGETAISIIDFLQSK